MKYSELSHTQKRMLHNKIMTRRLRKEDTTSWSLAEWCNETFDSSSVPGKSTTAQLLNQLQSRVENQTILKVVLSVNGANPSLEAALFTWIWNPANYRRMINKPLITAWRKRIQQLWNKNVPHDKHMNLSFGSGGLTKFRCRWSLTHFTCRRESGNADVKAAEKLMLHSRKRINAYNSRDLYNSDECRLFYIFAQDLTIAL